MTDKYSAILAIETATSACSVALSVEGEGYFRTAVGNNIHSQVLLSMVDEVLQQASITTSDLQLIVVGQGPGSFTGLRIGIGVAQGLAYGANCPMIGLSSLDALALQAAEEGPILAGIDARMGEIYWCEYVNQKMGLMRYGDLRVTAPQAVTCSSDLAPTLVGNAWAEYWDRLGEHLRKGVNHLDNIIHPSAAALLELAMLEVAKGTTALCSPIDFVPEYVRDDVAKKSFRTQR
jgi:tRNA threonylcarbamoyladenosine biosynthesis protein TsaB